MILILSIIIYKGFRALEGCIRRGEGVVEGRRLHLQREGAYMSQRPCRGPDSCIYRGEGVAEALQRPCSGPTVALQTVLTEGRVLQRAEGCN